MPAQEQHWSKTQMRLSFKVITTEIGVQSQPEACQQVLSNTNISAFYMSFQTRPTCLLAKSGYLESRIWLSLDLDNLNHISQALWSLSILMIAELLSGLINVGCAYKALQEFLEPAWPGWHEHGNTSIAMSHRRRTSQAALARTVQELWLLDDAPKVQISTVSPDAWGDHDKAI